VKDPLIICLCPTYKRPKMLANVIKCFEKQRYHRRFLIVLDDAGQISPKDGDRWAVRSVTPRFANLPMKFMYLARMAVDTLAPLIEAHVGNVGDWGNVIFAVWEDDDVYLPHHLESMAKAAALYGPDEKQLFFAPSLARSDYSMGPHGDVRVESAVGRFHASWGYSHDLFFELEGYPATSRLDFDQQMHRRCRENGTLVDYSSQWPTSDGPSYVYRWGRGPYNGSQAGEQGYQELWRRLASLPAPPVPDITPELDPQTARIFFNCGFGDARE
jgi:hypothetical protein